MVKRATIPMFLLAISIQNMKKGKNAENGGNQNSAENGGKRENVFVESINMETQTVFYANGSINIYPCDFELGQHIVAGKNIASQRGRMTTDDDGRSHFRPYAVGSGSRYMHLFDTHHGGLKSSPKSVVVRLAFPKKMGKDAIESVLREEMEQIKAYIESRSSETEW